MQKKNEQTIVEYHQHQKHFYQQIIHNLNQCFESLQTNVATIQLISQKLSQKYFDQFNQQKNQNLINLSDIYFVLQIIRSICQGFNETTLQTSNKAMENIFVILLEILNFLLNAQNQRVTTLVALSNFHYQSNALFYGLIKAKKCMYALLCIILGDQLDNSIFQINYRKLKKYSKFIYLRIIDKFHQCFRRFKIQLLDWKLHQIYQQHQIVYIEGNSVSINSHTSDEQINEYLENIAIQGQKTESFSQIYKRSYCYQYQSYKGTKKTFLVDFQSIKNQEYLQNYISAILNDGGGYILTGFQQNQNQTFTVQGLSLSQKQINELDAYFNKCFKYIQPSLPEVSLTAHFLPVFLPNCSVIGISKQQINLYTIRIWLSVGFLRTKKVFYCVEQFKKKFRICVIDANNNVQQLKGNAIYKKFMKKTPIKFQNPPPQPPLFIQNSNPSNQSEIILNQPKYSFNFMLKFPLISQETILTLIKNQLQKNQIKYSLIRPKLHKYNSQTIAFWMLGFNDPHNIVHKIIKDTNKNNQITDKLVSNFIEFNNQGIHLNHSYLQFLNGVIEEFRVSQYGEREEKIFVCESDRRLYDNNGMKYKKINQIAKQSSQKYTIWQLSNPQLILIVQGIAIFSPSIRFQYLSAEEFEAAKKANFLIQRQTIQLKRYQSPPIK